MILFRSLVLYNHIGSSFFKRFFFIGKDNVHAEEWSQLSSISRLPIIHHENYVCPLPDNHRFKMKKFEYLFKLLVQESVINERKQVLRPNPVSFEDCCSVHSHDYVYKFFSGLTSAKEQRITGFEWTHGLLNRVRYETGGTLLAARVCLNRGLACSTAGGTHHAFPSHGAGFCLINDLAVTAYKLCKEDLVNRVLLVDLDVHQGDGSAFIFSDTPEVFTLSFHCGANFPLRKQKSDLDINLPVHTGDDEYMRILEVEEGPGVFRREEVLGGTEILLCDGDDTLPFVMDSFRPDLVLYDAGVDPHKDDTLGKLDLTSEGLYRRDIYVLKTAICRGVPVTTVIGGGYDNLLQLSARHTIIHRACTEMWNNYL